MNSHACAARDFTGSGQPSARPGISDIPEPSANWEHNPRMSIQDHLPPLSREFVSHFGEMGSRWGINRTVGQIYALLFISQRALHADDIAEALEFSRSNVSMGLK